MTLIVTLTDILWRCTRYQNKVSRSMLSKVRTQTDRQTETQRHATKNITAPYSRVVKIVNTAEVGCNRFVTQLQYQHIVSAIVKDDTLVVKRWCNVSGCSRRRRTAATAAAVRPRKMSAFILQQSHSLLRYRYLRWQISGTFYMLRFSLTATAIYIHSFTGRPSLKGSDSSWPFPRVLCSLPFSSVYHVHCSMLSFRLFLILFSLHNPHSS